MEVLNDIADLERLSGPLHLAIGVFDGVHLGHQAVINAAKESAASTGGTSVVVTLILIRFRSYLHRMHPAC
jgi:riboflavin kinase/FMN adenylyltransferase